MREGKEIIQFQLSNRVRRARENKPQPGIPTVVTFLADGCLKPFRSRCLKQCGPCRMRKCMYVLLKFTMQLQVIVS